MNKEELKQYNNHFVFKLILIIMTWDFSAYELFIIITRVSLAQSEPVLSCFMFCLHTSIKERDL